MAQYFKRFTSNPQADLERGYSFMGYALFNTKEQALEYIAEVTGEAFEEDFDLASYVEDNGELVGQDNVTGKWGQVRSGLCGFGGFETLEEALADDTKEYRSYTEFHIFLGDIVFSQDVDGQDDGVTFQPIAIVQ